MDAPDPHNPPHTPPAAPLLPAARAFGGRTPVRSRPLLHALKLTGAGAGLLGPVGAQLASVAAVGYTALQFPERPLMWAGAALAGVGVHAFTVWSLRGWIIELGLIRSALRAFADGDTQSSALWVAGVDTPENRAWDALLAELRELREAAADASLGLELRALSVGGGDLARVFDTLPTGLVTLDADQRIQSLNGAACRLLHVRSEDVVGRDVRECLPSPELARALDGGPGLAGMIVEAEAADAPAAASGDAPADAPGGSGSSAGDPGSSGNAAGARGPRAVLRATCRPIPGEGDRRVLLLEDVTQQRAADHARHVFVAQATHELRTPLTNIALYLQEVLELGGDEAAQRASFLNIINGEVARLDQLIAEVLEVSEVEAGSLQLQRDDVALLELLQQLGGEYAPRAEAAGLTLEVDLPPKLPVLQGDRAKLLSAVHNLLGNALKYTPAGGAVHLSAAFSEATVAAGTGTPAQISIVIRDTGIGIGAEELDAVFQKFGRASNAREEQIVGTGLGLPLAREVARLHGGDVTAESELGAGSTFTLTLPVADGVGSNHASASAIAA